MDHSLALPLIEQIYEAALDPPRWHDFVESLATALDAHCGFALQLPGSPLADVVYASAGLRGDPALRVLFADLSRDGMPWESARSADFVGRFGLAEEALSREELVKTDFFRDWMQPQGLAANGPLVHTIALHEGRPVADLVLFASEERTAFGETELGFGNLLVPHLTNAYRVHALSRQHHALGDAIDRFPTGVVLLDSEARVLHANLGARHLLDSHDGLLLEERQLRASDPADDIVLRRLIASVIQAAARGETVESHVVAVERRSMERALPVMVSPLRPRGGEPTLSDAVVAIYVADLAATPLRHNHALRELYGLTEAESHLVELLCQGCSLDAAAEVRGVTMNTARSQLKQVFAKTHTSRQSELVRLVLSGVASIGEP